MAIDHPQRRGAPSAYSLGRIKLPNIPPMPDRLKQISPELEAYDRGVREAFASVVQKLNHIEEILRNRVDGT